MERAASLSLRIQMECAASLSQIFDRGVSLSLFVTEEVPEPENK